MNSLKMPNVLMETETGSPMDLASQSTDTEISDSSFSSPVDDVNMNKSYYFRQLSRLFQEQLYSSVLSLASFVSTLSGRDKILSEAEQTQITMFCADSAYNIHDYLCAENFYKKAIQMHSSFTKSFLHFKDQLSPDFQNDARYKVYLCQMQCKKPIEALTTLQSIPAKQRSVKVNMALGKLYLQNGLERAAVTSFKEVVKKCPMAMDAIESLASLGLKEADIQNIVQQRNQEIIYVDWFNSWLKASVAFYSNDFVQALSVYSHLQEKTSLMNNHRLLVAIGKTFASTGDYASGIGPLLVAHTNEFSNFVGMDILAFLLWTERRSLELEKLAFTLMDNNKHEAKSEPFVAMAYYCQLTNRNHKALQFAGKGIYVQGVKNSEALLCKAHIFLEMQYCQNALPLFREASTLSPNRFEPQKGIFDCYLATHRYRDAMTIATAFLEVEKSPRVLTMCAFPLTKESSTMKKAKNYLEKALNLDNRFLPAVFLSVDILEEDGELAAALNILMKIIDNKPHPSVHNKLADLLVKMGKEDKAADHFNIALKLNPNDGAAKEGLRKLNRSSRPMDNSNSSSVVEVDVIGGSDDDEEDDLENGQSGNVWEDDDDDLHFFFSN